MLEKQGERKNRHKLSQKTAATAKRLRNTIAFPCPFYSLHLSFLSMNNLSGTELPEITKAPSTNQYFSVSTGNALHNKSQTHPRHINKHTHSFCD